MQGKILLERMKQSDPEDLKCRVLIGLGSIGVEGGRVFYLTGRGFL